MALVFQIIGFLAGSLALRGLFTGNFSIFRERLAGVGAGVAIVAAVLFWGHVWQVGSGLPGATRNAAEVSSFAAEYAGDPRANNMFLVWARRKMLSRHSDDTYNIEPASILDEPELDQWITYVLLPARATANASEANYVLYYDTTAYLRTDQRRSFNTIMQYAPGYSLAVRSNAR